MYHEEKGQKEKLRLLETACWAYPQMRCVEQGTPRAVGGIYSWRLYENPRYLFQRERDTSERIFGRNMAFWGLSPHLLARKKFLASFLLKNVIR